jgi:hypothetical protein
MLKVGNNTLRLNLYSTISSGIILTSSSVNLDINTSIIVLKLNTNGNLVWTNSLTGGNKFNKSLAIDNNGNIYVDTYTSGGLTEIIRNNISSGITLNEFIGRINDKLGPFGSDIHIVKLNNNGRFYNTFT